MNSENRTAQLAVIDPTALQQGLADGIIYLVDVREGGEFAGERIEGAVLHPLSQFNPGAIALPDGKQLVLYCQSGNRSGQAAQKLLAAGFGSVTHLQGGLLAWKAAGQPVTKSANAPISLFRQVQIVAGSLALGGTVLGFTVSPKFHYLSGFVGAGLMFAGLTNTCAMGMLLAQLPYNQNAGQSWK
ncbi:MAG: rhodanese-like domain-containing protein [Oscillatoriales cyanobacterium SM2_2_1]|nr:rhodanese-like domain-containing protein [Oscillatoriales cyanobacterium SM2_2_1]